jgi:ATP-dependent Clp protease, protease subunit
MRREVEQDQVQQLLLKEGIYFLSGDIDENSIGEAMEWIQYENIVSKKKRLTLFINSVGGSLYDAFALIDVMRASKLPVDTVGVGAIMSAAFLIFVCGDKRKIAPNTSIMCHQHSDTIQGKHHDLVSTIKDSEFCNLKMLDLLDQQCTKLTREQITKQLLTSSDVYLDASALIEMGGADDIYK